MIELDNISNMRSQYCGCEGFQVEHIGDKSSDVYLIDGGNHYIAKGMPQINLSIMLETFELLSNAPELLKMVDKLTSGITNAIDAIDNRTFADLWFMGNVQTDGLKALRTEAIELLDKICSKTF